MKKIKKLFNKLHNSLFFISLISLFWFLIRSGRKPSRAACPCQRAALAQVSSYFIYIFPLFGFEEVVHFFKYKFSWEKVYKISVSVSAILLLVGSASFFLDKYKSSKNIKEFEIHKNHSPIGMFSSSSLAIKRVSAQGFEHRVVSVHDSGATDWDYVTGYHWQFIDQDVVNTMIAEGMMRLTGTINIQDAWRAVIPYQSGESIVIKLNFNNTGSCSERSNDIDAYPEPVNAVIDGLISIGVPAGKIWITDPSRIIPDRFREGIKNPYVQYYTNRSTCNDPNEHKTNYVDSDSSDASTAQCPAGEKIRPAQVFVDADHIINIPLFKSHGSYITLALKNHYGSVIYRDNDRHSMHKYFNEGSNSKGCDLENKNILADINNNHHIRDKTRLVIGDGLFGNPYRNWMNTERWDIFGDDDPNILFFSVDPVAISSVMTDYIIAERGNQDHEHLHAAAKLGLGIHEHWDSFQNKQYSAIDYIEIEADLSKIIHAPLNFSGEKVMNRSLFLAEYINVLKWEVNPNNENVNIVKYRIYQIESYGQDLLVELSADKFEYWHRKVEKDKQYTYAIVAVNEEDRESKPAYVTIQ